jgi:hypothetical protein
MGLFRRRDPRTDATFAGLDNAMAELEYRQRQLEEQHADELRRRIEEDADIERRLFEWEAEFERRLFEEQRAGDAFCLEHGIERDDCYRCYGTGCVDVKCSSCDGEGYRNNYGHEQRQRCIWCHGGGKKKEVCPDCGGIGRTD